jgi:hypothetical protein
MFDYWKEVAKNYEKSIIEYLKKKLEYVKENRKKISIWQILAALIIPILIFFPFQLQNVLIPLAIIFIILIILTVALRLIFLPLMDLILNLVIIISLLILTQFINCGNQACFWVLSTRIGTLGAYLVFFGILFLFIILAISLSGFKFWASSIALTILIIFFISWISPKSWYAFCKNIPFLSSQPYCNPRVVKVDPIKTITIPVGGGISVKIEPASTLYAGEPYEFSFSILNKYERPIEFTIQPSIISSYGKGIEFIQPFQQKTNKLSAGESYQDSVYINPNELKAGKETCSYWAKQIAIAKGFYKTDIWGKISEVYTDKVECARDKPCKDNFICGEIGTFDCICIDWTIATCSKESLRAKINVKHSGFFLGSGKLYYSENITKPVYATKLVQGPLSVTLEFQPNPYIAQVHKYVEDVSLYVTFKNEGGGDIDIRDFKVEPQNTVIHTIDKEKEIEIIEEVGTQIISCRNIDEILHGYELKSGQEVGGILCKLAPPHVKLTIKNLTSNTVEEASVSLNYLKQFCNRKENEKTSEWNKNWENVFKTIDNTGLCEILSKKEETGEKRQVERGLSFVNVIVEFYYERSADYFSSEIIPYTRTKECLELEKKEESS